MFPRRTTLLLLVGIVLLSLAVRYPLVEHERFQSDSYFIHGLSNSIVKNGHAAWTFNPLSYVGYYPFSYPSGVPFVLAEISSLTGLNVDASIIVLDGALATMFCAVVFCLTREFVHRVEYALLATLLASIAPRFVDTTYWVGSARGMEVVLISLVVLVSFRASFSRNNYLLVIAGLVGAACFAVHHMAVLIILFGIAFVLADLTVRYLPRIFRNRRKRLAITSAAGFGVIASIVILNYFEVLGNSFESIGETGFFSFKIPVASVLSNLVLSYTHQVGVVLLVAALSVLAFLRTPRFFLRGIFPFSVLLVFVPVLGSSLYVSMILTPFVAIVGVIWFQRVHEHGKRWMSPTAVISLLLVSSMVLTIWSVDRWNETQQPSGDAVKLGDGVFNDAIYLKWNGGTTYSVSNTEPLRAELGAYCDVGFLGSGIQATINGDVTEQDIENNITQSTTPFPGNLYTWLVYKDDSLISRYVQALIIGGVNQTLKNQRFYAFATSHSRILVIVDNNWPSEYVSMYGYDRAAFPNQVRNGQTETASMASYCTYESQRVTLYMVQIPIATQTGK